MNGYLANPRFGEEHLAEIQKKNDEAVDAEGYMHSGEIEERPIRDRKSVV